MNEKKTYIDENLLTHLIEMEYNKEKEQYIPPKIFVDINQETNELCGFYTEGVHSKIPKTAVEITEEAKESIIAEHKRFKVIDLTQPITLDNLEVIPVKKMERPVTETEKLRADVDFLMIMGGFADV